MNKVLDLLLRYSDDVLSDKPLSCKKHKWAAQRFISDVDRMKRKDSDFPFVFDGESAGRFFEWMRLFKHRKGVLSGKTIEPHIIQKFIFGNVYGWKHRETGYRRFNKFYWQVARKGAKSQSLSCVGTYELMAFNGAETMEVYCAATKREQAKVVYDESVAMLRGSDYFNGSEYAVAYGTITHHKTGGTMRPLSKEDKKTGDGLNPQCGIVDEYHAHETDEVYNILDSGMGARRSPLLAIITTAGFNLDVPCYRVEYDLVSKILNPDIDINFDSYFCLVNELDRNDAGELVDDIKDPAVWVKANPIVCSYPEGVEYIRKKLEEGLQAPEKMRNVLTKHMNVWVQMREAGYMNMAKWNALSKEPPDLRGEICVVGIDLSAKIDLTSVAFEFKKDDTYIIFSHSFIPEEQFNIKIKTDRVPYDLWQSQGWVTVIPGAYIDYKVVMDYAFQRATENGWTIQEWCLDPWGALQLMQDLTERGETVVEIRQGAQTLSEPTKDFRAVVYDRRVITDGSPVLSWAVSNAIVDTGSRNETIVLNKGKSRQRIDPVAAVINAHVRAMAMEECIYDKRGLIVL